MKQEYSSRHSKSIDREAQHASRAHASRKNVPNQKTSRRKKTSPLIIIAFLLIILAALLVLVFVYIRFLTKSSTKMEEVPAPSAVSVIEEPTPEPTIVPTPEPTPTPELIYTSSFERLNTEGRYLSPEYYDGTNFYSFSWEASEDENTFTLKTWRAVKGAAVVTDFAEADALLSPCGTSARENCFGDYIMRTETGVALIDDSGSISREIECGYTTALVGLNDGKIGVSAWGNNGLEMYALSDDCMAIDDSFPLPDSALLFADGIGDDLFYYTSGANFYAMDENGESTLLFNWTAMDLSPTRISCLIPQEDGSFICVVNTYNEDSDTYLVEFVTISLREKNSYAAKTELVLLSMNPVDTLQDAIMDYNHASSSTRIVLYTLDAGNETYASLQEFFETEMEGRIPDIFDLTGMPYQELAATGLLEDLYPFLDADAELNRGDIMSPVLACLELSGKLYGTAGGFTVSTVVGNQKILGDISSWSYNDYNSIASTMGEGTYPFGAYDTRAVLLNDLLGINLSRFVNWNSLSCSFDSAEFTSMLEFLRKLPEEARDTDDAELIRKNIQLLLRTTLYNSEDMTYVNGIFASPAYVGLPTMGGSGNSINVFMDYAITSSCANKQEAWQFVRQSFLAQEQDGLWYFPSNRNVFESKLSSAQESEAITEAEAESLRKLVEGAVPNECSAEVYYIVWDNIQGYLEGRDTVAGAEKYVQDAVSNYLSSLTKS